MTGPHHLVIRFCTRYSTEMFLWLADALLSCFLVFPLMVLYWRGIWDLFSVYIFPEYQLKACWTISCLGCATIIGYVTHPIINSKLRHKSPVIRFFLTKVYMTVYAVLPMAYWRGVWMTADYYLSEFGWRGALVEYIICELLLIVGGVRRNAAFPPLYVTTDTDRDVLTPNTRFCATVCSDVNTRMI